MRPNSTISLPIERAKQLRALAAAQNLSLTELIGQWINAEIEKGHLPDQLPGFTVKTVRSRIVFQIGSVAAKLKADEARDLANELDGDASQNSVRLTLLDSSAVTVSRKGRGLIIEAHDLAARKKVKRSVTPDLARDLARQLRRASDAVDTPAAPKPSESVFTASRANAEPFETPARAVGSADNLESIENLLRDLDLGRDL